MPKEINVAGFGNSQTCRDLHLIPFVSERAWESYVHDPLRYSHADDRKAQWADVYLTSANAVSMQGHIVNIDGTGNRVSATCFGPEQVIYVIGQNKIAGDLEGAIARAKEAAVINVKRYNKKTPCAVTGKCEDCLSPECLCGVMTIHRKALIGNRISILFVRQDLGF